MRIGHRLLPVDGIAAVFDVGQPDQRRDKSVAQKGEGLGLRV